MLLAVAGLASESQGDSDKKETSYETILARSMRRYAIYRGDHRPSRSVAKYLMATGFAFDSRVECEGSLRLPPPIDAAQCRGTMEKRW